MTPLELLADLDAQGVRLTAHGDRLAFDAPSGVVTPDLRGLLKAHKPELLAILAAPVAPERPETHADRELTRFEGVAVPWRHGWRDPRASVALLLHLRIYGRAMAARERAEKDWPKPGN